MILFPLGQARKCSRQAEQLCVAAINTGHQGVRQNIGRFLAGPATHKIIDRLVSMIAPPWLEKFR
jgi:hypothetical protein